MLGNRLVRIRLPLAVLLIGAITFACGSSAATTPPPTATPMPTPTPNPHLTDPASVDTIYQDLRKAGLQITANTADAGEDPVKTIHLTYESWPLVLEQYTSAKALLAKTGFDPKKKPAFGDPAFEFAGLNILVAYGPRVQNTAPSSPDPRFVAAVTKLVDVIDPLLGPLEQSSVLAIYIPSATPVPTPTPKATPTKKPKPTRTPRPTKKP